MSFLPAWKYQMDGMKWPLIIFYFVIAAMLTLMGISISLADKYQTSMTVGGLEMASVIFIFIVGLNSFKSTFHMLSANSVSRKTMFLSFLAVIAAVAAGMAVIDSLYALMMRATGYYQPAFEQMYGLASLSMTARTTTGFIWMICCYLAAGMTGYLISALFYRMSKPVKLLVTIGVPVLLLFVLPAVDFSLFDGAVAKAVGAFFSWASGLSNGNPYMGMVSNAVLFVLLGCLSYFVLRRAPVKARQQ
jgi:hypothetical protein